MNGRESEIEPHDELSGALWAASFVSGEDETLLDRRGRRLTWLLDLRQACLRPEIMAAVAMRLFESCLLELGPFQLAAVELAGVPLAIAIQSYALRRGLSVNCIIIRKRARKRGRMRNIEGRIDDTPVVLIDDLLNSGRSILRAARMLRDLDVSVSLSVTLVSVRDPSGPIQRPQFAWPHYSLFGWRSAKAQLDVANVESTRPHLPGRVVWKKAIALRLDLSVVRQSSPALKSDRLFIGTGEGTVYAICKKTGATLWRHHERPISQKGIWATPALGSGLVIIGNYNGKLKALDQSSGAIRWERDQSDWIGSTAELIEELNIVVVGIESSHPAIKGGIEAYSLESGETAWLLRQDSFVHSSPLWVPNNNVVVAGNNNGQLCALSVLDGSVKWQQQLDGPIRGKATHSEATGAIIVGTSAGSVWALDDASGVLLWHFALQGPCSSTPLVINELVYITSQDKCFYIIDTTTGQLRWRYRCKGKVLGSPILRGRGIYFGCYSGDVYRYDRISSSMEIVAHLPGCITTDVCVERCSDGNMYVVCDGRWLYALPCTDRDHLDV